MVWSLDALNITYGLGIGYGRMQLDTDTDRVARRLGLEPFAAAAFTMKPALGISYTFDDRFTVGLEAAFFAHLAGDQCVGLDEARVCRDFGSGEVPHNLQVGAVFAYHQ